MGGHERRGRRADLEGMISSLPVVVTGGTDDAFIPWRKLRF